MISPNEYRHLILNNYDIDEIILDIDEKIKKSINIYSSFDFVDIVIDKDIPKEIRDIIGNRYCLDAGWNYFYHHTSLENGERSGLTNIILSMKDLNKDNFYVIKKEKK